MGKNKIANKEKGNSTSLFALVLIGFLILVICGAAAFVGYLLYEKNYITTHHLATDPGHIAAARQMVDLYNQEGGPAPIEGKDPTSYGLDDTATSTPSGFLLFSGKKINTSNDIQIFSLGIATGTGQPEVLLPTYNVSAFADFSDPTQPSDFYMVTASSSGTSTPSNTLTPGIYHLDLATGKQEQYAQEVGLTQRNMKWSSNAGLLAFNRLTIGGERGYVDILPLDNWTTVLFDPKTQTEVATIAGASMPQWSPDGKQLLYLRTDGLYLYDVKSKEQQKVMSVAEHKQIISTSMIDLSHDGKYLAWTTAKSGMITISEITSWAPFTISELGRLHAEGTEYYWPQFSPDGLFYAVQAIDTFKPGEEVRKNGRMEIRPTLGRTIVYKYPLDAFAFNVLFTDDWIAKLPKSQ